MIKLSTYLNNGASSTSSSQSSVAAVRYDTPTQGLELFEQENARLNIDAISTEDAFIFSLIM